MTYSAEYATDHPTRDEVEAIREPTVVEFGQPGCGYCQAAAPLIKTAFADFTGVGHLKLEDAKGRLLGRAFKVKQWPTLIFLQEGEEVARLVRPQSEQAVREALEKIDTKAYRDADQAGTGGSKDL